MRYPDWWKEAVPEVHAKVEDFVEWVRNKISTLPPRKLIEKNPFLFRARATETADELADRLIDAFLSSSEETRFGDILEGIAISVCAAAKGGRKSSTQGIDLEYDSEGRRTIVQVKSGKNWGNSSQRKKLEQDFRTASRVLRQNANIEVRAVEGVCYGPSQTKNMGNYYRIIGKDFWEDISGWRDTGFAVLYVIEIHAGNGLRDVRVLARSEVVEYLKRSGCATNNGEIVWEKLFDLIMMPVRERPE